MAVRHIDDLEAADIETMLARDGSNLSRRSDEDRNDDASFRGFDRATQRGLFAGEIAWRISSVWMSPRSGKIEEKMSLSSLATSMCAVGEEESTCSGLKPSGELF
jgi:hypothetical protein